MPKSGRFVAVFAFSMVVTLASALASPVRAEDGFYDEKPPEPRLVTLSVSPFHLFIPMLELQVEVRAGDYLGFAVLGGGGRVAVQTSDSDKSTLHFDAYEAGVQAVAYPFEPFQKLQLGVEVLWLRVKVDEAELGARRVTGLGAGLSLGPLIGYKWISDIGFTVFVQGGFSVLLSRAHATNELGQSATVNENQILMLLNFNLGWSF